MTTSRSSRYGARGRRSGRGPVRRRCGHDAMSERTDNATRTSDADAALRAARRRTEQRDALWALTSEERVAAMWRRELTLYQLLEWSGRRPEEVPRIATDLTPSGEPGEFAWIVIATPEWAEADER